MEGKEITLSWQEWPDVQKKVEVVTFSNGELKVLVPPEMKGFRRVVLKVRFYPQINRNLILTLLTVDALKELEVERVVLEAWWFPYSPQNKVFLEGEPLSMRLVIRLLETAGVNEFVIYDLHHIESLSYFTKPVVHLSFLPWFEKKLKGRVNNKWLVVSPDKGGSERATQLAKRLGLSVGWFVKKRDRHNGKIKFEGYRGPSVLNKKIILIDDFSAGGGTLLKTAKKLKEMKAKYVLVCLSHLLMPQERFQGLRKEGSIDEWLIGNGEEGNSVKITNSQ